MLKVLFSLILLKVTSTAGITPSQENLSIAMEKYGIELPYKCYYPEYNPDLKDRGVTTMHLNRYKYTVQIGPAAFSSWGMLAATLAHEVEVHCNQNLELYAVKHLFGYAVEGDYEKEAYEYEIKNAERFGLTKEEVKSIQNTYDQWYGVKK